MVDDRQCCQRAFELMTCRATNWMGAERRAIDHGLQAGTPLPKMAARTAAWLAVLALWIPLGSCTASVDGESGHRWTALTQQTDPLLLVGAAERGDLSEVDRLLVSGTNLEAADSRGRTALIAAAYGAHLDVAGRLIEAGADVNAQDVTRQSTHLIATSEIGEDSGLQLLRLTLTHGADLNRHDSYNGTGLIRASHRGYPEIVDVLLAAGDDVDHVNGLRWTALLEAILLGQGSDRHVEVVRRLVASGADVNRSDGDGVTPLQHARSRGFESMVEILRRAGGR